MSEHTKCKKHRQYKVILKPRADCVDCWKMYAEKAEAEARLAEAERLLAALSEAESKYRHHHDHTGSEGMDTGRWWDKMRRRGNMARAFLEGK